MKTTEKFNGSSVSGRKNLLVQIDCRDCTLNKKKKKKKPCIDITQTFIFIIGKATTVYLIDNLKSLSD